MITDVAQQLATAANADTNSDPSLRKASDIVAERLPGLHYDKDKKPGSDAVSLNSRDADAPTATTTVKATPTLHPDHYTPGTVPSAAELLPGARHNAPAPAAGLPN